MSLHKMSQVFLPGHDIAACRIHEVHHCLRPALQPKQLRIKAEFLLFVTHSILWKYEGCWYPSGTKELQQKNYIQRKESERKRREMFDDALDKFKRGDIETVCDHTWQAAYAMRCGSQFT